MLAGSVVLLAIGLRGHSGNLADRDFIAYWSAGQLLVRHQNPYSDDAVFKIEKEQGYKEPVGTGVLNPPWALVFVVPLGFVSAYTGALVWTLVIVACIMITVRLLRRINAVENSQDHLIAYSFAPVLACIMAGQMSGFACLGLVLFLWWRNTRPFVAGLAASVLTIKPHLFFLFLLVLLFASIRKKDMRPVAGVVLGVLLALSIPLMLDHHIISEYMVGKLVPQIGNAFIPTMSFLLRIAVNRNVFWIQFVPLAIATVWTVWYYWRNRDNWDWNRHGLLLLVVSMWVAPYSTFLDELVLLPAVVSAICLGNGSQRPKRGTLPLFFVLNGIAFLLLFAQIRVMSGAYVWSTTAWLIWYLYATDSWRRTEVRG